jgi:hypothetical protein
MFIPDEEARTAARTLKSYLNSVDGVYMKYYCPAQYDDVKSFVERVEENDQQ